MTGLVLLPSYTDQGSIEAIEEDRLRVLFLKRGAYPMHQTFLQ